MGNNRIWILCATVGVVALAGCGTIANRAMQDIQITVRGSRTAHCDITTSVTRNTGNFPGTATVERSREPLVLDCVGQDNLHKKLTVRPVLSVATGGNVFTGVVPGLAYDMASGGMWLYPQEIIVDFRYPDLPEEPTWPEDALAQIPPAELGDMPGMLYAPETTGLPNNASLIAPAPADPNAVPAPIGLMDDMQASNAPTSVTNMKPIVSPEDYESAKPRKKAKAKKPVAKKSVAPSTESATKPSAMSSEPATTVAPVPMMDELSPDAVTQSVPNDATIVPSTAPAPVPTAPVVAQPAPATPVADPAPAPAPAAVEPAAPTSTPAPATKDTSSKPKASSSLLAAPDETLPTK